MSKGRRKVVVGMELTDEQRLVISEMLDKEWHEQLDTLDRTVNSGEPYDRDRTKAMMRRMGTLFQLRKKVLA